MEAPERIMKSMINQKLFFQSAAVTSQGELFTWGRGNYGRLGHGTNSDSNIPLLVETLKGSDGIFIYFFLI